MERDDELNYAVLDSAALRPGLLLGAAGKGLLREIFNKSSRGAEAGLQYIGGRKSSRVVSSSSSPPIPSVPESPFEAECPEASAEQNPRHSFGAGQGEQIGDAVATSSGLSLPHIKERQRTSLDSYSVPTGNDGLSPEAEASLASNRKEKLETLRQVRDTAVLQFETLSHLQTKLLFLFIWGSLVVSTGFLGYAIYHKIVPQPSRTAYRTSLYLRCVGSGLCLAAILICSIFHMNGFLTAWQQNKIWTRRRLYFSSMAFMELCTSGVQLIFLIAPNAINLVSGCSVLASELYTSGGLWIGNFTCFNTVLFLSLIQAHNTNSVKSAHGKEWLQKAEELPSLAPTTAGKDIKVQVKDEAICWDLPIRFHARKLMLWLFTEANIIATFLTLRFQDRSHEATGGPVKQIAGLNCRSLALDRCRMQDSTMVLASMALLGCILYFLLYAYFVTRRMLELRQLPFQNHKVNNLFVRMQLLTRLPCFAFFLVSTLAAWYVRPYSCTHYVEAWLGLLPIGIAVSASTLALSYLAWPVNNHEHTWSLNVWLQEFSWLEEDMVANQQMRNSKGSNKHYESLQQEPMFCMQTAVTALYWALLVYDVEETTTRELSLSEGCSLLSPELTDSRLIWEKDSDAKLIMAWNAHNIVLAFRGTASMSNVFADLQAWQAPHLPRRGRVGHRPKVHAGFQRIYHRLEFSKRMLEQIKELMQKHGKGKPKLRILVTGHSLGGALATLAAYDVAEMGRKLQADLDLTCITFGAARTGNHTFVKEFNALVPQCWNIMNDQDLITRRTKLLTLYKYGGHRVIINMKGDLIVRPTSIESSIRMVPCSGSVSQHMLTAYVSSFLMVLLGQFCSKGINDGANGAAGVVHNSPPLQPADPQRWLKQQSGLSMDDISSLQEHRSGISAGTPPASPHLPSASSRKINKFIRQGLSADSEARMPLFSDNCMGCFGSSDDFCYGERREGCGCQGLCSPGFCSQGLCSPSFCCKLDWFQHPEVAAADRNVSGLPTPAPSEINADRLPDERAVSGLATPAPPVIHRNRSSLDMSFTGLATATPSIILRSGLPTDESLQALAIPSSSATHQQADDNV